MKKVSLTRGLFALVDDEDYGWLIKRRWQAAPSKNTFYAIRTDGWKETKRTIRMHRLIMKASPDQQIDHINGNTLDNRKVNLRFCSSSQNCMNQGKPKNNTSGFKGVVFDKRLAGNKKWRARITYKNKSISLKYHLTAKDAAIAYNEAAKKYHGEFAFLNKI